MSILKSHCIIFSCSVMPDQENRKFQASQTHSSAGSYLCTLLGHLFHCPCSTFGYDFILSVSIQFQFYSIAGTLTSPYPPISMQIPMHKQQWLGLTITLSLEPRKHECINNVNTSCVNSFEVKNVVICT
jgi:hypothetical protein